MPLDLDGGAGQLALVGALQRRGAWLLSDDQPAIDPLTALAYPSYPSSRLWRASAERLGVRIDVTDQVKTGFDTFHHRAADRFEIEPRPVRAQQVLAPTPDRKFDRLDALVALARPQAMPRQDMLL